MCQPWTGQRFWGHVGCMCGCCCGPPGFRRFFSSEEEKESLQAYRDQLKKELAGVEERIKDLSGQ